MKCILCGEEAYICTFSPEDAICEKCQDKAFNKNTKTRLSEIPYTKRTYSPLFDSKTGQWRICRIPGRGIVFENFPDGYSEHCGRNSMTASKARVLGCPDELFNWINLYRNLMNKTNKPLDS